MGRKLKKQGSASLYTLEHVLGKHYSQCSVLSFVICVTHSSFCHYLINHDTLLSHFCTDHMQSYFYLFAANNNKVII